VSRRFHFLKGVNFMFRKTLLATSALVVASSMALASQHAVPTGKALRAMHEGRALAQPGLILGKDMMPIAVNAAKPGNNAQGNKIFTPGAKSDFSKAPNARVLSYFGWLAGKSGPHTSGPYSYCFAYSGSKCISGETYSYVYNSATRSAAQPFTGEKKASVVAIYAEQYSGTGGGTISIHNNTTSGCGYATTSCPGTAVAGASGTFTSPPAFTGNFSAGELQTVTFPSVKLTKTNTYWIVVSGGASNGTVAWNGQDSNFTSQTTFGQVGEDFNDKYSYTFHEHYYTRSGYTQNYNTPYSGGTGGWIQTSAFAGDESGAFSVN